MTEPLPPVKIRTFGDDKTTRELLRPLSGLEISRRSGWASMNFGNGDEPHQRGLGLGAMVQRVNRVRLKRRKGR